MKTYILILTAIAAITVNKTVLSQTTLMAGNKTENQYKIELKRVETLKSDAKSLKDEKEVKLKAIDKKIALETKKAETSKKLAVLRADDDEDSDLIISTIGLKKDSIVSELESEKTIVEEKYDAEISEINKMIRETEANIYQNMTASSSSTGVYSYGSGKRAIKSATAYYIIKNAENSSNPNASTTGLTGIVENLFHQRVQIEVTDPIGVTTTHTLEGKTSLIIYNALPGTYTVKYKESSIKKTCSPLVKTQATLTNGVFNLYYVIDYKN